MKGEVLVVKNIHRESPGLIRTVFNEQRIPFRPYNPAGYNWEFPDPGDYSAVIVLGGPQSANDKSMGNELEFIAESMDRNAPYLGICLGMQALGKAAGGEVCKAPVMEIGCRDRDTKEIYQVKLTDEGKSDPLFCGIGAGVFPVFQLHGEAVKPGGKIKLLGTSYDERHVPVQIIKAGERSYGIQGHLELTNSMLEKWMNEDEMFFGHDKIAISRDYKILKEQYRQNGRKIIENFLEIAGLR